MDDVAVTPERVRASIIQIVDALVQRCREAVPLVRSEHIGGDTWFFESENLELAVQFGVLLLRTIESKAKEGFFFLKPSLSTRLAEPKLLQARFLDDASIAAYRAADKGFPFRYVIGGDAATATNAYPWVKLAPVALQNGATLQTIDWRQSWPDSQVPGVETDVVLPTLLLDSEVIYSKSAIEALTAVQQRQKTAKTIHAFGGPAPLSAPMYRSYIGATLALLRDENGPEFNVLSYIPENEPETSFAWLELCRRLSIEFHNKYSFRAFPISAGQLRPFSFQIFDEDTVHLGLRAYSPKKGTPTMSSAIMFRDRQIAARFTGEFIENWRALEGFNDASYAVLQQQLQGLSPTSKSAALKAIDEVMKTS